MFTWEVLEGHLEVLDDDLALESHNGAVEVHQRAVESTQVLVEGRGLETFSKIARPLSCESRKSF
jgi:hypothetical protein